MRVSSFQLRCFFYVSKLGGLALAAKKLNVTQAAVSQAIKNLESELGVELFDRSSRNLRPTIRSEEILEIVERILSDFEWMAGGGVRSASNATPRTKIVFGVGPDLASIVMPHTIRMFLIEHPDIFIEMLDLDEPEVSSYLSSNKIDFFIGEIKKDENIFASQLLIEDSYCLIGRTLDFDAINEPLLWTALKDARLILSKRGSGASIEVERALLKHGLELTNASAVNSPATAVAMSKVGLGFSILPRYFFIPDSGMSVKSISDPLIPVSLFVYFPHHRALSADAEIFLNFFQQSLDELL